MPRHVILIHELSKTYRTGSIDVQALRGVTVAVEKGEFVAVMGPSGSGKSTFLNLVGCLDHPTGGSYLLNDTDVSAMTDDELAAVRSRFIGFVFQGFNLLPRTNSKRNIELPLIYSGEARRRGGDSPAKALLGAVGLAGRWNHTPNELSGGEQQRIAIARSLVNSPAILLADEPTGNLDSKMSDEIMDIFLSLNRAGLTILMVTHEESVAAYAKRLIKFKDGLIVSDEPMSRPKPMQGPPIETALLASLAPRGASRRRSVLSPVELRENLRSASGSLLQNKLRSVLTILGILIGVGAVIAMVSVGQGATLGVQQRIQGLGSNFLTITPGSSNVGGVRQGFGSLSTLTIDDADAIRKGIGSLVGVEPESTSRQQLKYRKNNWSVGVVGTSADYPVVRNWSTDEGSFFTEEDYRAQRTVVVLGQDTAANLFGEEDPLGKTVKIGDSSFRVVGLLQRKGAGGGFFSQDDTALIPITTLYSRFRHQKDVRSIGVSVVDKSLIDAAKNDIGSLLRDRHKLPDAAPDDFSVVSQQDVLQTVEGVSSIMTLLLGSIAGISLLVGGIGIMNIMLVSVTERTREIGIRLAIGALERQVLTQFLIEAVVLSVFGGTIGILFGLGLAWIATGVMAIPFVFNGGIVALAFAFSALVGVVFGYFPARRAARLDPIEALRHE